MTHDEARGYLSDWLADRYSEDELWDEIRIADHQQDGEDWLFLLVDDEEGSQTTVRVDAKGRVDWESQKV